MEGMQKVKYFERNFRPRFDACISFNVQPIDLKLKTLVGLDFNDHVYSFLSLGMLYRHHIVSSLGSE